MTTPYNDDETPNSTDFAALSSVERERHVKSATQTILLLPAVLERFAFGNVQRFAEELLQMGRFNDYCNLNESLKLELLHSLYIKIDSEIFFIINNLQEGMEPKPLFFDAYENFKDFVNDYDTAFGPIFEDVGSEEFQQAIFRYYSKYSQLGPWNDDTLEYEGSTDFDDPYIAHCALILKKTHGEAKVISVFDHMIRDTTVKALDFIRLVQHPTDLTDYPITWALHVIK